MTTEKRARWVFGAKSVHEASSSSTILRKRARSVGSAKRVEMKRKGYLALDKCAHATAGIANDFDGESVWVTRQMLGEETG